MCGYRVRVSKELHAFLGSKSRAQGLSPELLIERLVGQAFPGEFPGTVGLPGDPWMASVSMKPEGVGVWAIDARMS